MTTKDKHSSLLVRAFDGIKFYSIEPWTHTPANKFLRMAKVENNLNQAWFMFLTNNPAFASKYI